MTTKSLDNYLLWLKENALWNDSLIDINRSDFGGVGVFWSDINNINDSILNTVLLRVPKCNILSTKNSSIYNLLVDYSETQDGDDSEIDLTSGMHGLIICFIYELAMKEASPWHNYLGSIDPAVTGIDMPICLWDEQERKLLENTQCHSLGMDDLEELILLFEACVQFAKFNEKLVMVPDVLDVDLTKKDQMFDVYKQKLTSFGTHVQSVISRAFQVDEYHGPSLVPGADLFNHLSPLITEEGVEDRENVHFLCDGGEDVCHICGEQECDHMFEEMEEMDSEEDGDEDEDEEKEEEIDISELIDSGTDIELSESSDDDAEHEHGPDCAHGHDHEHGSHDEVDGSEGHSENSGSSDAEEFGEITMELIERLEREEMENSDDEEDITNDTIGIDNNDTINETIDGLDNTIDDDLQTQLQDSSQCVDIILTSLPQEEYKYELFNTYGNELSNPYLLQRYGFVCDNKEPNTNDSVSLNLQLKKYIQQLEKTSTSKTSQQLQVKFDWLETYFEMICELIHEYKKQQIMEVIRQEREEEGEEQEIDEDEDEDIEDDFEDDEGFPDSWRSSGRITFDGSVSDHLYLILRLVHMPFKIFKFKLLECKQSKLDTRIIKYFLNPLTPKSKEKLVENDITTMIKNKLNLYPTKVPTNTPRQKLISEVINQEQSILHRYSQ